MKRDHYRRQSAVFHARRYIRVSIILLAFLLCSCAPSHSDRIVVGSKNFTESMMLGELVAQEIEARTH